MINFDAYEVWFLTGSQHLYGSETLRRVDEHSRAMVEALGGSGRIPVRVVWRPVLTTPESIRAALSEASANRACIGVIAWMHTFSPGKMWINGLTALTKPLLHLHTQFNRDIPWSEIDMDFMNLNQSAHGDREFGHITARLRLPRTVIAGFWQDADVQERIGVWARAAAAVADMRGGGIARFGDNMRYVAVTEGDKVSAEITLGLGVNGYGVSDLAEVYDTVSPREADRLVHEYVEQYEFDDAVSRDPAQMARVGVQARIEIAMRRFLERGGFTGFTTTFEDLHGIPQLPGLAVQRLMADGYGFGAEGDWKQAALVRAMKVMATGLPGGTSFMEDYTYHMEPGRCLVLGAHMLEICPSIAAGKPRVEVHPLGIGGKDDPARLVFDGAGGDAINATLVDMGDRFRILVNEVKAVPPPSPMPKLPVARVTWIPKPDFTGGLEGWILAGGAHHTGYSTAIGSPHMEAFAAILGLEFLRLGEGTSIENFKRELLYSEAVSRSGARGAWCGSR